MVTPMKLVHVSRSITGRLVTCFNASPSSLGYCSQNWVLDRRWQMIVFGGVHTQFIKEPTNALFERWRPGHKNFISCGECTITLEGVALQLGLPVDGSVITGSVVIPGKEDLCEAFLGKVPNKFQGGQIEIRWLQDNFKYLPHKVTNVVKEQYAGVFILRLIGGILMPKKS
ncbi:hypothetical protein PVK06_043415 [Gossypium arboreum]|uniref:Aminotransferase-like plant mobile domain-containing protein n=1 Tax=Gossypium arboreum TaxID=29729 RepID=A0ABR0MQG3_GOSAR|nr:hypothetical protein PVK06_043415 [Gossypium arboreum]